MTQTLHKPLKYWELCNVHVSGLNYMACELCISKAICLMPDIHFYVKQEKAEQCS